MELVYTSIKIEEPIFNLVQNICDTIDILDIRDVDEHTIKMGGVLFSVLDNQIINHDIPVMIRGIECIEDNSIEDRVYCIYRKDKSIPIKLTPVKTLNEWFANLPLIQKIDHYNSHISIIANNLK